MNHVISFTGYDKTIDWHIVEVNQALATLQIDVWHQDKRIHQMTLSFEEYDQFALEFRIVHEQFPGIVSFENAGFIFELIYDRLGHVRIEWHQTDKSKHTLQSDQSYVGQALALIGVYT